MWRKGNPSLPTVGRKVGAAAVENSMEVAQKIKNRTTRTPLVAQQVKDLALSLQGLRSNPWAGTGNFHVPCAQPKKRERTTIWSSHSTSGYLSENNNLERYIHPSVHGSTIYSSQHGKPKCPSMDKYTHTHNGTLFSHEKWNFALCSNMDGLWVHYVKENKAEKNKHLMTALMRGLLRQNKNKSMDRENRLCGVEGVKRVKGD